MTKLGRLVKANKIKSMEEIYLHSLPIKEYQIVDFFLPKLKDEVMKVSLSIHTSPHFESSERNYRLLIPLLGTPDQACAKANPRRSTYPVQGYRRHW